MLQELQQSGTIEVDDALLDQMGFDFNMSTIKEVSNGCSRYFVFNLGLEKLNGPSYRLIQIESHVRDKTPIHDRRD